MIKIKIAPSDIIKLNEIIDIELIRLPHVLYNSAIDSETHGLIGGTSIPTYRGAGIKIALIDTGYSLELWIS